VPGKRTSLGKFAVTARAAEATATIPAALSAEKETVNIYPILLIALQTCLLLSGIAFSQDLPQVQPPTSLQTQLIVDMSIDELRQQHPSELSDLIFDSNQDELTPLLKNAGMRVQDFFRDLSNTSSKEQVLLQILRPDGKPQSSSRKEFYYLIVSQGSKSELDWKEDRVDKKGHPAGLNNDKGFIMTSGFSFLCIYLHPHHQPGSRFRYLGRSGSRNGAYLIAFAQKTETPDYLAAYTDLLTQISTPYLLQGFVWLHPDSYQITRMETSMIAPAGPVQGQATKVNYQELQFEGMPHSFWLPDEVSVNLKVRGVSCRNRHLYSDYKLFDVQSDYKITSPGMSTSTSSKAPR
jgi:hypothetical protein